MRYRIIMVSPLIFINLLKDGLSGVRVVKNPLPKDTKYVRSFTDDAGGYGRIGLVVESESFDEVKEGDLIPKHLETLFEKI